MQWHAHRHEIGQNFLNQFVRQVNKLFCFSVEKHSCALQNIAEIDEIPFEEKIEEIDLPAAERAIYLELEHHLRALDMTIKRGKKTESDREKRLSLALGDSKYVSVTLLHCSFLNHSLAPRKRHSLNDAPISTLISPKKRMP